MQNTRWDCFAMIVKDRFPFPDQVEDRFYGNARAGRRMNSKSKMGPGYFLNQKSNLSPF